MSKKSSFAKLIKLIMTFLAWGIKTLAAVLPGVIRKFIDTISKRLRFSITFKTAVTYSFTFSLIFLIISSVILLSFGGFLLYESKNSLENNATFVRSLLDENNGLPEADILNFAKNQAIELTLLNQEKEIIYTTDKDDNSLKRAIEQSEDFYMTPGDVYVMIPSKGGQEQDTQYIIASKSLLREKAYLLLLLCILGIVFFLSVLIIVVKGSRNLKKMLSPIDDMIHTAKSISANHLHTRLNVINSHDELKDLAETFNNMLDRLEASYEQQNQFVSDASHELRTPISVIQGYANLLQRWGKEDKAIIEESLKAIQNESENMKQLVERLLLLARMDKETQKIEKKRFLLNDLINDVIRESRMIDSEHDISCHMVPNISIEADPGLLKQALRILVDNSIKYTPAGGYINIHVSSSGSVVSIAVEDNGIGISNDDLPFVFNRFYKCDKSRTREKGGTGLGLSIAKWIIEKHGGCIDIESVIEKGTKVYIKLPSDG